VRRNIQWRCELHAPRYARNHRSGSLPGRQGRRRRHRQHAQGIDPENRSAGGLLMATFWNKLSRIGRVIRGVDEHVEAKFEVAQTTADNRRHWANADGLSARAAVSPEVRRVVRIRSRYEADNNSWYRGMLRTAVNHIVGKGPQLQVTTGNWELDLRIEAAFQRWATHSDFAGQLRLMVEAYWRDGEVCAHMHARSAQHLVVIWNSKPPRFCARKRIQNPISPRHLDLDPDALTSCEIVAE